MTTNSQTTPDDFTGATAGPGDDHLGDRMHALLEGAMPPAEATAARAHLAACGPCRTQHRKLQATLGLLGGMGSVRAPEGFATRVLKRMRAQRRVQGLRAGQDQKIHYEGGIIVLLAAAGAALIVGWAVAHNTAPLVAQFDTPAATPAK